MPAPAVARQPDRPGGGWFSTPLAQRLLREEQRQTTPLLTGCYGCTGLYLRCSPDIPPTLSGNMLQSVLSLHLGQDPMAGDLICSDDALPLQRETVDLVYLLHALESTPRPHELLREIENALAPEGNVILVVLNPYSLWRLRWMRASPRAWSIAAARSALLDAGLDVVRHAGLGPVLPWLTRHEWLDAPDGRRPDPWSIWRAGYMLHARKRRGGLTPIRPRSATVSFEPGMHPG